MSYSNQTVHYGIPLPQQTDLVNGLDWNTSSETIDGALYDATQIATTVKADMEEVKTDIVDLKAEDVKIETAATELTARVSTIEQNMQTDEQNIQDAFDMITDKEVTQAQADVHVDEKEWFRYNGVLYVATKEINIGDTIVPNENCRATNIEDEMPSGGGTESYAEQMITDVEVVGDIFADAMSEGTYFRHNDDLCLLNVDVTAGTKLVENSNYSVVTIGSGIVGNIASLNWDAKPSTVVSALSGIGDISDLTTNNKAHIVDAINELVERLDNIGGGSVVVDPSNVLYNFYGASGTVTYTATEDCCLMGLIVSSSAGRQVLKLNDVEISYYSSGGYQIAPTYLKKGTVISAGGINANCSLAVFGLAK